MSRDTLHSWIHHWAGETPGKPAIIFDGGEIDYLTYSDEVGSVAAALGLRLDLKSIVLLRFPLTAEAFVAFYGCAEAGMLPLIIGEDFSPADLPTLAEQTGAKALMLDDKTRDFDSFIKESESLDLKVFYCGDTKIDDPDCISLREAVTLGNPTYRGPVNSGVNPSYAVKYTGLDEYATVSHDNALYSTNAYIEYFRLSSDDTFLAIRSRKIPFHEFSTLPILTGGPIIIMENRRAETIYSTIEKHGVTILQVDDEHIARLAELKNDRPPTLQHIIWSRSIYDGPPDQVYDEIWGVPVTRFTGCFAISGPGFVTFGAAPASMLGAPLSYIIPEVVDVAGNPVRISDTGILELSGPTVTEPGVKRAPDEEELHGKFTSGIKVREAPRNFFSFPR